MDSSAYQQTLDYLYSRLPMFSRIGPAAMKPDLKNILLLCKELGNPQEKLKTVHIAGTNGKGSVSHMLAAIFQNAGYNTGLYTSPHLVDFRERIRINGIPVPESFMVEFVDKTRTAIESIEPSFFEITLAMAFAYFESEKVDVAIIETGLGGRLDSTNIITPELSFITNISLDHTELLGNSISAIAYEKAGIIKQNIPVVIGTDEPEAMSVFKATAEERNSKLYRAKQSWEVQRLCPAQDARYLFQAKHLPTSASCEFVTDMSGTYQQENIATVLTAVDVLQKQGWRISIAQAVNALRDVKSNTGIRGRWEILQEKPMIVADVAHNPAGLKTVLEEWSQIPAKKKHVVVGFVRDKDVSNALALFPKDAHYHFCAANIPRALPVEELIKLANESGLKGEVYTSVAKAVTGAKVALEADDALLITGSFFIVGEAFACF